MANKIKMFKDNIVLSHWILLGIIVSVCFIFYQHGDILHTCGSSINILNGHILDFYDYNATTELAGNNYLPTTYFIFAIWNIPVRLLGLVTQGTMQVGFVVRMWYKLGTTVFYIWTGYFMYKIARYMWYEKKESLLCAFLFYSSPIAVFSQFIFGQYDIITTFFMVMGYYYFLKKEDWKFVACFAVAMTCKYFALLVFLPLLLFREKRVIWIIIKSVAMMSLFVFETLVYIGSAAFRQGVFGFSATNYIFNATIDLGYTKVSIVVILFVLLCAYSYFLAGRDEEKIFQQSVFIVCAVMCIAFGFSFWHPQWVIMATPFLSLAIFLNRHTDIYLLLDTLLMGIYVGFTESFYVNNVDQILFSNGILRRYYKIIGSNMQMCRFFNFIDHNMWFSMFTSVLLVMALFSHHKYMVSDTGSITKNYKGLVLFRTVVGNLLFVVPSFICLAVNFGLISVF